MVGRGLPIPELLAEGSLYPDGPGWRWPYLVMTPMPGRALREIEDLLAPTDWERTGDFLGTTLRKLHDTPVAGGERLAAEVYLRLLETRIQDCPRDHRIWRSLPDHLRRQVDAYVWESRHLIDPSAQHPRLIHSDLHAGNVFLKGEPGATRPTGIIDFNDVYLGDPHYDLVAVHVRALRCDKRLLGRVLDAYDWGPREEDWPRRMLALTLAHDYDMVRPVADRHAETLARVPTLDELATLLWDLDAPGLI